MRKYRKSLSITLASLLLASSFPINGGTALAAAQGSNFVYVISSLNSFGDVSSGGIFRGEQFTFEFTLPSNVSGRGHVQLQVRGLNTNCNRFEINGTQVNVLIDQSNRGGLEVQMNDTGPGVLKPGLNRLLIRSLNSGCTVGGDLDEFILTNIVVFYQTQ